MPAPPPHPAESARIEALREYDVLDRDLQRDLGPVLELAAQVTGASAVVVNLIDEERQHQLAAFGAERVDVPRAESMCAHSILQESVVHVPDARLDERFAGNPFVTGQVATVRLYAAAPLRGGSGHPIGTLCVTDDDARSLSEDQLRALDILGRQVITLFELRLRTAALARAEEELRARNEELARSNRELEQFAHATAHDLRAPLQQIGGFAALLQDHVRDEVARDYAGRVVAGVYRMADLIDAVLAYATVHTAPLVVDEVDTSTVLECVVDEIRDELDRTAGAVRARALPVVAADRAHLERLFRNLVGNALKFSRPGVAPDIAVGAERQGDRWRFSVVDNGVGIAPEDRERVFGMFERAGSRIPGSGIGLATVRRIVERHGGEVWVEGTDGGGTAVVFTLPAASPA